MVGYYLHEHKQRIPQYNATRRNGEQPSGVIVVHTAESTPDNVGLDSGAEGVANFVCNRSDYGSYHTLVDSDSILQMAPAHDETFHCRFTNPHSVGVSAACKAHEWHLLPEVKRRAYVVNLGKAAAILAKEIKQLTGITVPARRISRAQALAQVPGFIAHGETDPTRRSDPGPSFDWALFFSAFNAEMSGNPVIVEEDDMTPLEMLQASFETGRVLSDGKRERVQLWQALQAIYFYGDHANRQLDAVREAIIASVSKIPGVDPEVVKNAVREAIESVDTTITFREGGGA